MVSQSHDLNTVRSPMRDSYIFHTGIKGFSNCMVAYLTHPPKGGGGGGGGGGGEGERESNWYKWVFQLFGGLSYPPPPYRWV